MDLTAVDVAIGLVLLYLILALMCSTLQEFIASATRRRAKHLRSAIKAMLGDPKMDGLAKRFVLCLIQIVLFLAYAFVFGFFDEKVSQTQSQGEGTGDVNPDEPIRVAERNYVQIALVMSAYLAGITFMADRPEHTSTFQFLCFALFGGLWLVYASEVFAFVRRNFRLEPPVDIVEPLTPVGSNVLKLRQVR